MKRKAAQRFVLSAEAVWRERDDTAARLRRRGDAGCNGLGAATGRAERDDRRAAAVFGKGKQYPDIYLDTAKTLGVPPENCIMLDDVSASLKAARQAGMMTIGIIEPLSSQSPEEMELYSDKLVKELDKDIFTF